MYSYSVLMSVYYKEQANYFIQAIESMLKQTVPPSDFVIVCDGPLTLELNQVIDTYTKQYPNLFQIIKLEENKGLGIALQTGIHACKYEIIARMDSDDISVLDRMEKQLEYLAKHPEISAVGGQIAEFNGDLSNVKGYRIVPKESFEIKKKLKSKNPMNHVTVSFRKKDVLLAGSYQNNIGFEDYYLWNRMILKGEYLSNLNDVLVYVRVDQEMYSRRSGINYFKQAKLLQDLLLKNKLISHAEYFRNIFIRFIASVVISNHIREFLFLKIMRKQCLENE